MNEDNRKDKIAKHITDVMMKRECEKDADFENWLQTNEFAPDVLERLTDYDTLVESQKAFSVDLEEREKNSQLLLRRIERRNRRKLVLKISTVAAALIFVSFVLWNNNSEKPAPTSGKEIAVVEPNREEREIPKIIMENGEVFYLKTKEKAIITDHSITQQNGTSIAVSNSMRAINDSVIYSNLIVPKQSTYAIELPDGTVVHLNANSKLTFPNKFVGSTREVTMEGEAFFKVAKDAKKPFIVNYKNTKIEVYGTQFNVNTYSEHLVKTFLVEGSVGVRHNKNIIMMRPNQISVVNEVTNSNTVSDVALGDRDNIVGWLSDIFVFNNMEIKDIVKILSDWYGEELIVKEGENECVTAYYKRSTPLSEIIGSLEIIVGKKIIK